MWVVGLCVVWEFVLCVFVGWFGCCFPGFNSSAFYSGFVPDRFAGPYRFVAFSVVVWFCCAVGFSDLSCGVWL